MQTVLSPWQRSLRRWLIVIFWLHGADCPPARAGMELCHPVWGKHERARRSVRGALWQERRFL